MYESPLSEIFGEIQTKIIEHEENQIVQAVQNCGINVDKEELTKALMYDRHQYEKGYADAKAEMRWVPCSERLPENGHYYLWCSDMGHVQSDYYWDGFENGMKYGYNIVAWMPLPPSYKGE